MAPLNDLGLNAWENWRRSRGQLWVVVISIAALGCSIYAVSLWRYWRSHVTTDDARIQARVTPVSSRIPGTVIDVLVKDNQEVKAGEILALLDPRDYEAGFQQARAAVQVAKGTMEKAAADLRVTDESTQSLVQQAEAALRVMDLGARVAAHSLEERQSLLKAREAAVGAAGAEVGAAEAAFQQAKSDRDRMGNLLSKKIIAQQEFDHAEAAFQTAEARLAGAQKKLLQAEAEVLQAAAGVRNLKAALEQSGQRIKESEAGLTNVRSQRGQVKLRQAELDVARGRLEEAMANLRQAELNLGYTTIRAPTAGRVTMKRVEAGQVVQPGQALLTIVESGDVWVVANYKETQLAHVKPGQSASLTVDAYPGIVFKAKVDSIQAGTGAEFSLLPPENATGNFVKVVQRVPVKLVLEPGRNQDHHLVPGMSVVATIETSG